MATWVYVVNGKSPTGAESRLVLWRLRAAGPPENCMPANQYNPQLTKAGLQSFPRPSAAQLATLTAQVATNNRFSSTESASDAAVMAAVRQGIQHVIFIIKENRTYDQILGDLPIGNGDPDLTEFGQAITPNLHNLARSFVTLDNFMDTAEVSYDGWLWSTSAQAPDVVRTPIAGGLRVPRPQPGFRGRESQRERCHSDRRRAPAPPIPSHRPIRICCRARPTWLRRMDRTTKSIPAICGTPRCGRVSRFATMASSSTRPAINTPTNAIPLVRNPFATGTIVAYPHECRPHPVHRSVLPRFRQLASGLLPLHGVGAGLRCQLRQQRQSAVVEPGSLHARSHRKLRHRD